MMMDHTKVSPIACLDDLDDDIWDFWVDDILDEPLDMGWCNVLRFLDVGMR